MLEKVLQHNNLGSWSQITYIIDLLSKDNYSIHNLKKACIFKEYSFSNSFNGLTCLLQWLDIIQISNLVSLNNNINSNLSINSICNLLFLQLAKEKQLHYFLNSNNLIFKNSIYVRNSLIKLRFSSIRNFLIALGFFEKDNLIYNQFFINKKFLKYFIDNIVPLIEVSHINNYSLEDLKNKQNKQEELGADAERFVLIYEKRKRKKHSKYINIKIISNIDTNAGYDIQSYQYDDSLLLDKFIEVKSYSGKPYFYWSKNEIKVAKQEKDNYFLYLVNRDKMDKNNYQPKIIQNPYKNILNNKNWHGDCQSWKFELMAT